MTNNTSYNPTDMYTNFNFYLISFTVFSSYNMTNHIMSQIYQSHGLLCSKHMLWNFCFTRLDTCGSHVCVSDGFYLLNTMLKTEIIINSKKWIQH